MRKTTSPTINPPIAATAPMVNISSLAFVFMKMQNAVNLAQVDERVRSDQTPAAVANSGAQEIDDEDNKQSDARPGQDAD